MVKHIVIIGGGPAGIAAAQNAAKCKDAKITILERRDFAFHAPGALRAMVDTSFIPKFATADNIAFDSRSVTFTPTEPSSPQDTISYDYLIIATGSSYPGPIKPTGTIIKMEDMTRDLTKAANDIKDSERILIIGGGAVGIEMAGEIKAFYPDKKVMLIDPNNELLSNSNVPKLREPIKKALLKFGVDLFLGERLNERFYSHQFGTKILETESGKTIESDAQLVCVGMKPNIELMKDPDCIDGRFIKVKANMQVDHPSRDYENVFVIGDASNHPTAKLAYLGMLQGQHLGTCISKNIKKGKDIEPYVPPSAEPCFLPLGTKGGASQLPVGKGVIIGDFLTKMFKGKDLLSGMTWSSMRAKVPK